MDIKFQSVDDAVAFAQSNVHHSQRDHVIQRLHQAAADGGSGFHAYDGPGRGPVSNQHYARCVDFGWEWPAEVYKQHRGLLPISLWTMIFSHWPERELVVGGYQT